MILAENFSVSLSFITPAYQLKVMAERRSY